MTNKRYPTGQVRRVRGVWTDESGRHWAMEELQRLFPDYDWRGNWLKVDGEDR